METLKSGLEVTQGQSDWYHSKAWVRLYSLSIVTIALSCIISQSNTPFFAAIGQNAAGFFGKLALTHTPIPYPTHEAEGPDPNRPTFGMCVMTCGVCPAEGVYRSIIVSINMTTRCLCIFECRTFRPRTYSLRTSPPRTIVTGQFPAPPI